MIPEGRTIQRTIGQQQRTIRKSFARNWSEGLSCLTIRSHTELASFRKPMTTHVTCRRRGYGIPRLYPRSCPTLAPLTRAKAADYRIEPLIVKSLDWSAPSDKRAGCSMDVDKCFLCVVKAATYLRRP